MMLGVPPFCSKSTAMIVKKREKYKNRKSENGKY